MGTEELNDQVIKDYINTYYEEQESRRIEDIHLSALKHIYESNPTKENDENWLKYSNQVCKRRANYGD